MAFILCPKCNLNMIQDCEEECSVCRNEREKQTQVHNSRGTIIYHQWFYATDEPFKISGFSGYKIYDADNELVGVIFKEMSDGVSKAKCTIRFLDSLEKRYGTFHIIKSGGERIAWSFLEQQIMKSGKYRFFVD